MFVHVKSVVLISEPRDIRTLLKGPFAPKSNTHIFPLTCNAIYPSRLFWCELSSFGYIDQRDVCFLSNVMVLGTIFVSPSSHRKTHASIHGRQAS